MDVNIYVQLTKEFNKGQLRAIICSGQAAVLHRVAIMSKDGDWILREEEGALTHILTELERHGARYRFGAPLDVRWMAEGWSSHFEFRRDKLRVRTDFFTRPPRIPTDELPRLWREHAQQDIPFLNANDLAVMKKTNRERDYAVIGELARLMPQVDDQVMHSRSARDLIRIHEQNPGLLERFSSRRPVLQYVSKGRERLEVELDAERRTLIRANEARLEAYGKAATQWHSMWSQVSGEIARLPLMEAHRVVVKRAEGVLPFPVSVPQAEEGRDAG